MFQPEAAVATNGVSLTVIGQSFPTGTDTMKARLVDGPNCSTGAVYSADVGLVRCSCIFPLVSIAPFGFKRLEMLCCTGDEHDGSIDY